MRARLFFALETPAPVKDAVEDLSRRLQRSGADVKWEPRGRYHCTVRFLGETDEDLIPELAATAARIAGSLAAPKVEYAGLGAFPTLRDPRVIWVGLNESGGILLRLRQELDEAIARLGCPPDTKGFHPHVTLGRVRGKRGMRDLITEMESATFGSAPATLGELLLVRSDLRPTGSVYTTLHAFPFASTNV
jgi:RNA 2',3'-cyclic 3'-phosphodiesterase